MKQKTLSWCSSGVVHRLMLVWLIGLVIGAASSTAQSTKPGGTPAASAEVRGQETAVLTDAPLVPPPITRDHPTKVIVNLEVREVVQHLADGVDYAFWQPKGLRWYWQNDPVEATAFAVKATDARLRTSVGLFLALVATAFAVGETIALVRS